MKDDRKEDKFCGSCANNPICKLKDPIWRAWREEWQGRLVNKTDPLMAMFKILANSCGRYELLSD